MLAPICLYIKFCLLYFYLFLIYLTSLFQFFFFKWEFILFLLKVKVAHLCPTLCNPMDCIVPGIVQARLLKWVAFSFSRASSQPRDWTQVYHIVGRSFPSWATREALSFFYILLKTFLVQCILLWSLLPMKPTASDI